MHRVPLFSPPKLQSLKRKGVDSNLEVNINIIKDKTSKKDSADICIGAVV